MDGTNLDSQQPSSLAARLPPTLNLEAVARETGALRRRRAIKSGAQLLELALAYSGGALSLRSTALWAGTSGVGQICDVSVLDRLRNASEFLRSVLTAVLAPRLEVRGAARRVRVIDATTISSPGKGGEWRLHVDYDLARHQMISCELTEGRQSESLRRFRFAPGDIALGDRGYAKARDMQKVREAGADFVVRIGWNALRLRNADGSKFDLIGALPAIAPGEHVEVRAWIQVSRSKRSLMPVRLVLARHPKGPTVERNRSRATRKSAADGKKVRPETLLSAEYTLLADRVPGSGVGARGSKRSPAG